MTGPAGLLSEIDLRSVENVLLAYGIAIARPTAMINSMPVFTRVQFTGLMKGAIATALALPMVPLLAATISNTGLGSLGVLVLIGKEALVGFPLGLVLGAPFWALDVTGDLLDAQRGATQGRLNDPAGFADVSITGTLLIMAGVALFVATGGLQTSVDLLYRSWTIWKPLASLPHLDARTPDLALGFLDRITRQGLLLALPPIVAMLLADAGLMIVARLASQLRIDDLALALRNIVFVLFLPAYATLLITYMNQDLGTLPGLLELMRDATIDAGLR